jgi:hypothetical protein
MNTRAKSTQAKSTQAKSTQTMKMEPMNSQTTHRFARTSQLVRPFRALLVCALPIFGLSACVINSASSKGQLAQAVEGAKSVVVTTENGGVELIQDASATTMQISATIRCSADTIEKAEARVKATKLTAVRDASGRVRVAVEFPPHESAGAVDSMGSYSGSQDSASVVIRAASLDAIEVSTSNGRIDVGAFRGVAKLSTSNGAIEVKDHAGPVEARSTNGAIRASGVLAPIVAETSNGRIEISLAPAAQGDVNLETSNGSVSLELGAGWEGTVTADTSNGKIDLSGGEVAGKGDKKTMTIGDAAKAKAVIDTSNGRVTVRAATK